MNKDEPQVMRYVIEIDWDYMTQFKKRIRDLDYATIINEYRP